MRASALDIYRHPEARKVNPSANQSQMFKREYEVYSLGLILFEIGFWRRVDEFVKPNMTPEVLKERIEMYVQRDMSLWMGDIYKSVVLHCFLGNYQEEADTIALAVEENGGAITWEREDDYESWEQETNVRELNGFYRNIVSELGRCHCGTTERYPL